VPELKIERADARDGADNPAIGVVVVAVRRMADAVFAGARDPPLQADDLGDEPIILICPELSNGNMSLNRSDLGRLQSS